MTGDITPTFDLRRLFEPGIYRLQWQVHPHESKVAYLSNELLIMRDKDTPIIDPRTGLPLGEKEPDEIEYEEENEVEDPEAAATEDAEEDDEE